MPEYIEREALIARLQKICVTDDTFGMGLQCGTENAINCIKEAPTADVVEVVRCKNCLYKHPDDAGRIVCIMTSLMKRPDSFCSSGTRKEE